jgi:hypothetical protein
MSMINCYECGKLISSEAKQCPHCGAAKKKWGCGSIVVVIIGVIMLLSILGKLLPEIDHDYTKDQEGLAYSYAEGFVKKELKAPSSAQFPSYREKLSHTTNMGSGSYKIKSWVDCQNGFGAMLRQNFSCTITFKNNNATCTNLVFY